MDITSYINGVFAIFLFSWGFLNFVQFFSLYFKDKKKLRPIVGIMGLSLGSFYLGPTISFFSLLFTGENIPYLLSGYLSYTMQPVVIIAAMLLGFDIFKPKKQNLIIGIFALLGIIFWIALYGWPELMIIEPAHETGELLDVSLNHVVLIITIINFVSLPSILSSGFFKLRKNVSDPILRSKLLYLTRGWIVFAVVGILDAIIASKYTFIPRFFMSAAYFNIFNGFAPLKKKGAPQKDEVLKVQK